MYIATLSTASTLIELIEHGCLGSRLHLLWRIKIKLEGSGHIYNLPPWKECSASPMPACERGMFFNFSEIKGDNSYESDLELLIVGWKRLLISFPSSLYTGIFMYIFWLSHILRFCLKGYLNIISPYILINSDILLLDFWYSDMRMLLIFNERRTSTISINRCTIVYKFIQHW